LERHSTGVDSTAPDHITDQAPFTAPVFLSWSADLITTALTIGAVGGITGGGTAGVRPARETGICATSLAVHCKPLPRNASTGVLTRVSFILKPKYS